MTTRTEENQRRANDGLCSVEEQEAFERELERRQKVARTQDTNRMRARVLAITNNMPTHTRCGGECSDTRDGLRLPWGYWCYGCEQQVPSYEVVPPSVGALTYAHDVELLLDRVEELEDTLEAVMKRRLGQ